MTKVKLLQRRAGKAWNRHTAGLNAHLGALTPHTASDRINRLTHAIKELDAEEDARTYLDRLVRIRTMERDILAISEFMLKKCPPDFTPYFTEKREDALKGIQRFNERL